MIGMTELTALFAWIAQLVAGREFLTATNLT
jgi:hypothetical protein